MVDDARLDWEGELGAVVGNRLSHANRDEARMGIAGYVPLNDLSARGALVRANTALEPTKYDWVSAKSFDGSLPMGPGMVPSSLVSDPNHLRIVVTVDDVVRQDGSTSGLVSDVFETVAAASQIMTLEPGDVVATGTPGGVGGVRGLQLEQGNEVRVEIESVGSITTSIV
jgi:2,4-didehydro-3-deoxy-L-rhamnonate hydrolase